MGIDSASKCLSTLGKPAIGVSSSGSETLSSLEDDTNVPEDDDDEEPETQEEEDVSCFVAPFVCWTWEMIRRA